MCLLTMNENVFVSLEDPCAPTRADLAYHASQSQTAIAEPTHYRNTFLTLSPPGALEQLLSLLRARWISTKQAGGNAAQYKQGAAQLTVEGHVYAIGTDWIVRAGNVILAGGAVKGMLLEVIESHNIRECVAHATCVGGVSSCADDEFPRERVLRASFQPSGVCAPQLTRCKDGGCDN